MKLKLFIVALLAVFGAKLASAQKEADGFASLSLKEYPKAKKVFSALLKANPENAAALFGLGEYYYYTGKTDSAKTCYQKGLEVSSSYACNYAGLGKLALVSSPAEAETYFKDAIKKSKKEANAVVVIAKAYFEQTPPKLDDAKRYIDQAISIDSKNASAYFLNGLIQVAKNNTSDASLQFERTIYFDPNNLEAYLYQSTIMAQARNFDQAVEYINKALAINPQYWPAYKKLGELYYDNQKYAESVTNFATYFKNVPADKDVTHYAYSLFFNKQYQQAREIIDKLVEQNPNDYVLLRLMGYISFESKDLINGKTYMDKFFTLIPQDKILSDDYYYYGKMLSAVGNDSLAVDNFKLSLKKDPTQFQILDDLAKSYNKMKQFEQSLQYSCEYLKKKPSPVTADYFLLGKTYYSTANNLDVKTDSLKQLKYYNSADSLFNLVSTYSPNSYLGSFWRARVNSVIDKETTLGLAKPFYEKALESLIKDPVKYKKEISEIYAYLGFYYYQKDDKPNSLDYWKKLLEIDPENLKAQEAIKSLEKK
jgi:tetratricopeptide (TPR) repeat protein